MTQTTYEKEFTLKAWMRLGGEQVVLSGTLAGDNTILKIKFESLSLEKIINDLIQLVRPTYSLQLPYPWDQILGLKFDKVTLSYNIKQKSIGFESEFTLDVPLLKLNHVYIDAKSVHDVRISFDGTILGKDYDKLGWNLVGADGPPTPAPPEGALFKLNFLGLGQRLRLTNAAKYEHVSDAITDMESLFEPPAAGTLIPSFSDTLVFDNNSNWLFGLDAEIMNTVDLAIVFNDPVLYGLFISLKGEKAKTLDGLQFEILYKKITDDIGIYQIELKLPTYIRNMEFGSVSVTLPEIAVDIYTNGNFKIDFGFPRQLDFSRSFAVQVFPFVGFGGFYFAVLNGATASKLPVTTNGSFHPVLEFGIGLQVGVGKVFDKGILQASAVLAYVGVFEGTLAWFHASKDVDKALKDFYYRLNGTFAIVGKISGSVNFAIVSATLELTVYASVTGVIEACEPILLTFSAGVSVSLKVSVGLGLFTIHIRFSFHTVISYQFVIGSPSIAQWNQQLLQTLSPLNTLTNATPVLEALTDQEKQVSIELSWDAVFSDDKPVLTELYYFTQFSTASATDETQQQNTVGIAMLFAPNSDDSVNDNIITSLESIRKDLMSFEQIAASSFCWALNAANSKGKSVKSLDQLLNQNITAVSLANILHTINHSDLSTAAFSYEQIIGFIKNLFILNIKTKPDPLAKKQKDEADTFPDLNLSLFPMIPDLFFTAQNHDEISFATHHKVGADYLEQVKKLASRFSSQKIKSDQNTAGDQAESMVSLLFRDYFKLLIKTLLQSALDAMQVYKFPIPAALGAENEAPTLYRITELFSQNDVVQKDVISVAVSNENNTALLKPGGMIDILHIEYSIKNEDSIAKILTHFNLHTGDSALSNELVNQIFELNQDRPVFVSGKFIAVDETLSEIEEGDTLNSIIKRLSLKTSQIFSLINDNKDNVELLKPFKQFNLPGVHHSIVENDSLLSIANQYQVSLKALIEDNQHNENMLKVSNTILIENVRSLKVSELLSHLYHDGAIGHAAGTASRFFMYGLRLPENTVPGDDTDEKFDALYKLSGQQFYFNFEVEKKSNELAYDSITLGKISSQTESDNNIEDPLPWVAFNGQIVDADNKPAKLIHQFSQKEREIADSYEKQKLSPEILLGPVSIKVFNDQFKTFTFSNPILWQQESNANSTQTKLTPGIWKFPPSLRSSRYLTPTLDMVIGTQPQKTSNIQKDLIDKDRYSWGTLLPVSIRKLHQEGDNEVDSNTYEVYGTDADGIDLLTELVSLVNLSSIVESTQILFPSSPDENEAKALQSYDQSGLTLFINTNLSTETNPETLIANAVKDDKGIPSTSPQKMITRLWKSSLVRTGGYYLYVKSRDGKGLPDNIFSSDQTAEIYLLISYSEKDKVKNYMNSVAIEQVVDTQQSVLYAQWTVPLGQDGKFENPDQLVKDNRIARIPAILPGNAGFKIVRENPDKKFDLTKPDQLYGYQLETQYNLVDFKVNENNLFKDIGQGLPVGPEQDHAPEDLSDPKANRVKATDVEQPWKYKRVFPLKNIIKDASEKQSAYFGLGGSLNINFGWRDNYGNQVKGLVDDLEFSIKYIDYIIPLPQWPHLSVNYEFLSAEKESKNFKLNLLFQPGDEYSIISENGQTEDPATKITELKDKVNADLEQYRKILDQIEQNDIQLSFSVSMAPNVTDGYPQAQTREIMKQGIIKFADAITNILDSFISSLNKYQQQIETGDKIELPEIESIDYHWPELIANTNPDDIFPLEVFFYMERLASLIDPAFENVAQVRQVKSPIKPKSDSPAIFSVGDKATVTRLITELNKKLLPQLLLDELERQGKGSITSPEVIVKQKSKEWKIKGGKQAYLIRFEGIMLNIYEATIGLNLLADTFERLFPGMKISSAYTKGEQQKEVWIVRFKTRNDTAPDKNTKGIAFNIHHDQALFYAPQPLSTHLISLSQVPIYRHTEYGAEPEKSESTSKNFTSIDPELWAIDFLETLETTLRPEFSIPVTMFDNLIQKDQGDGYLYALLQIKQKLAEAIAFQTIPILEDQNMQSQGWDVAREKLKQQLLINLRDAYDTNAIVQYNVDVESEFPKSENSIPPNLFGQPYVTGSDSDNNKDESDANANNSLSTGKIALNGNNANNESPGNSYLTFIFNTQTKRSRSEVPLNIDYKINHLEFDIRKLDDKVDPTNPDDIKDYAVSKWLSFINPLANTIPPGSTTATTNIPIPIRQYPRLPTWGSQQFVENQQSDQSLNISEAKQVDYYFSYRLAQFTAQDTLRFEVFFNSKKKDSKKLSQINAPTDVLDKTLHQRLAQFNVAKEFFLQDMKIYLPQVKVGMPEKTVQQLTTLLESYHYLTHEVADAWYKRFDPNTIHPTGADKPKLISIKFDLDEGFESNNDQSDRFQITLSKWSAKTEDQTIQFIGVPDVKIDGYQMEAHGYDKESRHDSELISDKNRSRPWCKIIYYYFKLDSTGAKTYLSENPPLKRTINFKQLDVLLVQNAWPGLYVVRNANLSNDKQKPTSKEFIYTTAMKRFVNPVTPMLDISNPINIAEMCADTSTELLHYLTELIKSLLETNSSKNNDSEQIFQQTTLKILTSYSFSSNPEVGSILQPCFLIPPTLFDKQDSTGSGTGITLLRNGIINWFENYRPVQTEGRLYFDITFYSLLADDDLPVLRLRQLYLDVEKVTTLTQYCE